MSAPDGISYQERDATSDEATRGKLLDMLADGSPWVFLFVEPGADGLGVHMDASELLDTATVKALLLKVAAAIP